MKILQRFLPVLFFLCLGSFSALDAFGQSSPSGRIYDRRTMIIDSLVSTLDQIRVQQDSMRRLFRQQSAKVEELSDANFKLTEQNTELKEELKEAKGDNLQSTHTNSILFIFNVVVGIFLLIALIWMFMRKKGDDAEPTVVPAGNGRKSVVEENFEHKLERIQKLGNLRDKGLLTDEEFNLQKKQILGE